MSIFPTSSVLMFLPSPFAPFPVHSSHSTRPPHLKRRFPLRQSFPPQPRCRLFSSTIRTVHQHSSTKAHTIVSIIESCPRDYSSFTSSCVAHLRLSWRVPVIWIDVRQQYRAMDLTLILRLAVASHQSVRPTYHTTVTLLSV